MGIAFVCTNSRSSGTVLALSVRHHDHVIATHNQGVPRPSRTIGHSVPLPTLGKKPSAATHAAFPTRAVHAPSFARPVCAHAETRAPLPTAFLRHGCTRHATRRRYAAKEHVFHTHCWHAHVAQMCMDGGACRRKVCFFAHSQSELRMTGQTPALNDGPMAAGACVCRP